MRGSVALDESTPIIFSLKQGPFLPKGRRLPRMKKKQADNYEKNTVVIVRATAPDSCRRNILMPQRLL